MLEQRISELTSTIQALIETLKADAGAATILTTLPSITTTTETPAASSVTKSSGPTTSKAKAPKAVPAPDPTPAPTPEPVAEIPPAPVEVPYAEVLTAVTNAVNSGVRPAEVRSLYETLFGVTHASQIPAARRGELLAALDQLLLAKAA